MTLDEKIETLRSLASRLFTTLDDPHPGLATWNDAVGALLTQIADLAPTPPRQATTQPNTKCDADLFTNGRRVCILSGCSTAIEAVVVRVREQLEIPLDWHYIGGHANVLTAPATPPEMDEKIRQHVRMALPRWEGP